MSDLPRYGFREASALRRARHNRRKLLFCFRMALLLVVAAVIIAALVSLPRPLLGSTMRAVALMPQVVQPLPTALSSTGVVQP